MERDVTYIREELEEVILNQLRLWGDVIEQENVVPLSQSGANVAPGLLWHLSFARDALVKAEGVLLGGESFSSADCVLGFREKPDDMRDDDARGCDDDRYAGRAEDVRLMEEDVEQEILARFTSTGDIEVEERADERNHGQAAERFRA